MTIQYADVENLAEELKKRFLSKVALEIPEENTGYKIIIHNINVILYFPQTDAGETV
ncbi:MAG: hypothetical protein ACFFD4_11635 [Candidatus Odinarchaeota archaeon]